MLFDSRIRDKLRAKRDIHEGHLHRSRNRDFDLRFECMRCLAKDWCIGVSGIAILGHVLHMDVRKTVFHIISFELFFVRYPWCISEGKRENHLFKDLTVIRFF